MPFPNLLIIGAMKSGTTSLHDYLSKHPDIFMSIPKEIHYYNKSSELMERAYMDYFKTNKKIRGTTPQNYTKAHHNDFQCIPEKIYRDTPDVKLIYIVRDPFERILSHVIENRYGDTLERTEYNESIGHYWKTSMYYYQISFYLKYFKRSQIHILTLENLKNNKLLELNKIFDFLEVDRVQDESIFDYLKNDAASKKMPNFICEKFWCRLLNRIYPPLAIKLVEIIIKTRYANYLQKPNLDEIINEDIVIQIRQDAIKLQNEFEVDISTWNLNPILGE